MTLLSAVISALITATGGVIAALINRKTPEPPNFFVPAGYESRSVEAKPRRLWNLRSSGMILLALIGITLFLLTRALLLRETIDVTLSIFSAPFPFKSTGITVYEGDMVEITPAGQWNCGRSSDIDFRGYFQEKYSDTVSTNTPACALIGAISSAPPDENFDNYFLVETQKVWEARETGKFYLGCNDSIGKFGDNPTSSKLEVRIVVKR